MIPPPPAPTLKEALYDTECFPNYWLLKFRMIWGVTYSFRLRAGESFSIDDANRIRLLFASYTTISFNGIYYDIPMITAAISGYSCEQLKWLNDQIIPQQIKGQPKVYGKKPWELNLPDWKPVDHIDIMETLPGAGGQKQYAGRIHCKTMRDLPYDPFRYLTDSEMLEVDDYCENDLTVLGELYAACRPQLAQRIKLGKRYGLDLRSKSDAQVAEAVLKHRCEQATGRRIFKPQIDWGLKFRYDAPAFIGFSMPILLHAFDLVKSAVFGIRPPASMRPADSEETGKCIAMPPELENLELTIGQSTYKMGVGGLHSQEKKLVAVSNATHQIRMPDVASYYPNLILNSGAWPESMGESFLTEYGIIKDERLVAKDLVKKLKNGGFEGTPEYVEAKTDDDGGKIMINGTFGKTGSPYSVLFGPKMLIQTTLTGQLSLLMLIEWHELYEIPVVSANTDGIVINCPRDKLYISEYLIKEWEKRTGLEMETDDYVAIYARDVNSYFAIKTPDDIKRKGEYGKSGLVAKKNPDVEICADAVAEYLAKDIPIAYTIAACRDIRKFVTITKVAGGGVKLWGEGPRKNARVMDMAPVLQANGWFKSGKHWQRGLTMADAATAYATCFQPQGREYLGKVVRWYYGTNSPGPIVYESNGNTVGGSYGATPCMTLPDEFPDDIDYAWYIAKAEKMLVDIGK